MPSPFLSRPGLLEMRQTAVERAPFAPRSFDSLGWRAARQTRGIFSALAHVETTKSSLLYQSFSPHALITDFVLHDKLTNYNGYSPCGCARWSTHLTVEASNSTLSSTICSEPQSAILFFHSAVDPEKVALRPPCSCKVYGRSRRLFSGGACGQLRSSPDFLRQDRFF